MKKKGGLFRSLSKSVHGHGHESGNGNAHGEGGGTRYVSFVMQKDSLAPESMPAPVSAPGAGVGVVGGERRAPTATASAAKDPLLAAIEAMAAVAGMEPLTGQPTNPPPGPAPGEPLVRAPSASHSHSRFHSHHNHNPTTTITLAQDPARGPRHHR